jgi:hypothetical protein
MVLDFTRACNDQSETVPASPALQGDAGLPVAKDFEIRPGQRD